MFEVLAFLYENYWRGDACPELPALQRTLNAVGFDDDEIMQALVWLEELKTATQGLSLPLSIGTATQGDTHTTAPPSIRVFTADEQARLGCAGWGFVTFLVSAGALSRDRLELVMERITATTGDELSVDDIKLIVLMVFWSLGEEPEALILDELCDCRTARLGH